MSGSKTDTAKQRLGVLEQSQDGFFHLRDGYALPWSLVKCWVGVNRG
jgi:hypothetical protein